MNVLLTFGTLNFKPFAQRLGREAASYFDRVVVADETALEPEFWRAHQVLASLRGYYAWSWKPTLIRRELAKLQPDDLLMYCDATCRFVKSPAVLFPQCRDVLAFSQVVRTNRAWTKRDCFIKMGADEARYWNAPQVYGCIHAWRNTPLARRILEAWEVYCADPQVVGDGLSELGLEYPELTAHRHDQSILSILLAGEGVPLLPDPTQHGCNDLYGHVVNIQQRAF